MLKSYEAEPISPAASRDATRLPMIAPRSRGEGAKIYRENRHARHAADAVNAPQYREVGLSAWGSFHSRHGNRLQRRADGRQIKAGEAARGHIAWRKASI